jgi:hypothetical protein
LYCIDRQTQNVVLWERFVPSKRLMLTKENSSSNIIRGMPKDPIWANSSKAAKVSRREVGE